jgi:hypothetical protein
MNEIRPSTRKTSWPARALILVVFWINLMGMVNAVVFLLSPEASWAQDLVAPATAILSVAGAVVLFTRQRRRRRT